MRPAPCHPPPASSWQQSRLGGGGYITGLVPDPAQPGRLWARCDVAGVFLSQDGGRSFQPKNGGLTDCSHHSVESLAVSPHDSCVLFRCSGEARDGRSFGFIHGSRDGGDSWQLLTDEPDYLGNGDGRDGGEMIAVDPFDPRCIVATSLSRGVFASHDGGTTWRSTGLRGEPLKALAFHPRQPGLLYAGTLVAPLHAAYLQPQGINRPPVGRLYFSSDQGRSWQLLAEGPQLAFTEIQFAPDNDHTLYTCAGELGLWRSLDGGHTFAPLTAALPKMRVNSLAIDARNPATLYFAARCTPWNWPATVPTIPLYVSHDAGTSWQPLHDYTPADFTAYLHQPGDLRPLGWAIAKIRIDPFDSDTLYMSNWFGASVSRDRGRTWCGHHYAGLENICLEHIATHPTRPGVAAFTAADKPLCLTTDDGRTYQRCAHRSLPANYFCTTAAAFSRAHPTLVVYGVTNQTTRASAFFRTTDDGATATCTLELPVGLFVQSIREDEGPTARFWASVDGPLRLGAGLYRSDDAGSSWQRLPGGGLPLLCDQLPVERTWVENELLSVVWYQTKNACGTNQLLCTQPGRPGGFYWGEWTRGLWRTDDGGTSWTDLSPGLPFSRGRPVTLVSLAHDRTRPDRLYAGFIGAGLWRSDDRGTTWHPLHPRSPDTRFNASSVAADGDDLYVACEPLAWSPAPPALLHSTNDGRTWTNRLAPAQGALRIKAIALDATTRTLHLATCGNGAHRFTSTPSLPL